MGSDISLETKNSSGGSEHCEHACETFIRRLDRLCSPPLSLHLPGSQVERSSSLWQARLESQHKPGFVP